MDTRMPGVIGRQAVVVGAGYFEPELIARVMAMTAEAQRRSP
jgi:hypothetical protein